MKYIINIILACFLISTIFGCRISNSKSNSNVQANTTSQAIQDNSKKKSIVATLQELDDKPVSERISTFYKLKEEQPASYDFNNEDELNMYGYGLLWSGKVSEAVAIFSLIVDEFPESANAYDSLAESYLANGNQDKALAYYEKAIALNPANFNAVDQVEKIRYPERKEITPLEKFSKQYGKQAYWDDLDTISAKMKEIHPNAFKFIDEKDFDELIQDQKTKISEETTFGEFIWYCSEIIASVQCSHTSIGGFYVENSMLKSDQTFPIKTAWIEDHLYIIDNPNYEHVTQVKDEILKINGIPVKQLMTEIYRHIPAQADIATFKNRIFNQMDRLLITYALNVPDQYEIEIKGKSEPILLAKSIPTKYKESNDYRSACEANLCFEMEPDQKTAILTISSFNYYRWNNYTEFRDFIDDKFEQIKNSKPDNLIIDLRHNGGGSPESSIHLLKYLIQEPFAYFKQAEYNEGLDTIQPHDYVYKGNLYFLIDGLGNSTTGHFMAVIQDKKLGTIIGEELGSNQFCTGGQITCRTQNTKLLFYVAFATSIIDIQSRPDNKGIEPDIVVPQNLDAFLQQEDIVLERALQLSQSN